MVSSFFPGLSQPCVRTRQLIDSLIRYLWLAGVLSVVLLLAFLMLKRSPGPALIGWLVYFLGLAAILFNPRYGLSLMLFFGLIGDGILTPSFPFMKNFSSMESLLYLHDSLIFNPLETYLVFTFLSWLLHIWMRRKTRFYTGRLFWLVMVFIAFVIFGLAYGLGKGGNLTIALWESRPIFYMALMFVLASNLIKKREHFSQLMWAALFGLFFEAITGNFYLFTTLKGSLANVDGITEHPAAIHMNTFFVFALGAWMFKMSPARRISLAMMLPFVLVTYIATQRRAAFLSLAIALVIMLIVLYRVNWKAFWLITPVIAIVGVIYLAAFWNSGGAIGLPARAIKSVVAPAQADASDQSSDRYRVIENTNTGFTIHQRPLTGVGFGQKFYIIAPMPDISFFTWWEYIPHNSIIWVWLKTGVGGFMTMLLLVGASILTGVRALARMPRNELSVIALTATLYIIMHFTFAYVDMSWDGQSMVYLGAMLGMLNCMEHVVARPVPAPRKRWPWQPNPEPAPALLPFKGES